MRKIKRTWSFITCLLLIITANISVLASSGTKTVQIPSEVIVDKIRGGLLGQMIGNLNGLDHEFKYYAVPGNVTQFTPALPYGAETDDDTDFEWVYICEMQKLRTAFLPYNEVNMLWTTRINRSIWCANRYARYLMDLGIAPPLTGNVILNPWAEFNVSGQFLCETFGLLAPAMPQTAARIGSHYTRVAIDNEPAQATQLFTAMIATAYIESDINGIIDAGVASLEAESILRQIIADVRKWHSENPENWKEVHRLIHQKYVKEDQLIPFHRQIYSIKFSVYNSYPVIDFTRSGVSWFTI